MLAVIFGWVLFRAESFGQAEAFFSAMLGFGAQPNDPIYMAMEFVDPLLLTVGVIGIIAAVPLIVFDTVKIVTEGYQAKPKRSQLGLVVAPKTEITPLIAARNTVLVVLLLVSLISVGSGTYNPFIYFRF